MFFFKAQLCDRFICGIQQAWGKKFLAGVTEKLQKLVLPFILLIHYLQYLKIWKNDTSIVWRNRNYQNWKEID